jgi:hypothetical protein
MAQAAQSMDVLASTDNIKILSNVLKTNVSACTSIGSFYLPQIGRIFLDMLGLYKAVSGIISETIAKEGSFVRYRHHYSLANRLTTFRHHRHENAKDQATTNRKEGDFKVDGDVHQESRGLGRCQHQLHAATFGRNLGRLQP